ncbi:MAG: hypothetical protein PVH88_00610 [Ignavibacteria bacterium]|jgi:hypothetical protein
MKKLSFILLLLCFLQSCCENNTESNGGANRVSFYLLKDDKVVATDAAKSKIESLELSEQPIFSSDEISYYNWGNHSFAIDSVSFEKLKECSSLHESVFGIPFIVTVGKERIYLGAFGYSFSSQAPLFPHINITFISYSSSPVLRIENSWLDSEEDKREDKRILSALLKSGLLVY